MFNDQLEKVLSGINLTEEEMIEAMQAIMEGSISDPKIASFLTALKIKGESVSEITGGAKVMREKAEAVELANYYTVDTCGTGGDKLGTFNISTAVAFITAAAGVKVVKHGNRSVSSKSGSADVLEALGIKIDLSPSQTEQCVREVGIGFFFAPLYHKAMKYVGPTRRELGFRTIFNILGPLANPANASAQVLGVFDESLMEPMANVLLNLGVEKAMVVHGTEGLDELSICADTLVIELKEDKLIKYTLKPEDFGIEKVTVDQIAGGDSTHNAAIIMDLLKGEKGPKRDILILNAGAALYVGKVVENLQEGILKAAELIDSGAALEKVYALKGLSNQF